MHRSPTSSGTSISWKKLETKAGWNFPSPDDEWMRGYTPEMEDFVDAVLTDREPVSGIGLARDCVEMIYAAYLSAEQGRRVELRSPVSEGIVATEWQEVVRLLEDRQAVKVILLP